MLVLSTCHQDRAAPSSLPAPIDPASDGTRSAWQPVLATKLPTPKLAALDSATRTLNCLLADPGFFAQVERVPKFYGSRDEAEAGTFYSGAQLAELLARTTPEGSTLVVGRSYGPSSTASTGLRGTAGTITVSHRHTGLQAGCASHEVPAELLNTLVHEYMHLFPNDTADAHRFNDDGVGPWRHHAASYRMGNLAQCYVSALAEGGPGVDAAIDACMSPQHLDDFGSLRGATKVCLPRPAACEEGSPGLMVRPVP